MNTESLPIKQARIRNYILFTISAGLFIYVFLRAYLLSFTTDENGTFTMFLQKGIILPEHYDVFAANNHILNTALMMVSEKLFGMGELALRLPNVLFYILFLWSTAKIAMRFNNMLFSIGAFLLFNFHPFIIQYFSLARGYGIAMACSAAAIYFLARYTEDGGKLRHLLLVNVMGILMVFANFVFLNLYLPLLGFLFIIIIWQPQNAGCTRRTRFLHLAVFAVCVLATLLPALHILLKMKEGNALFAGANALFMDTTIRSLFLADLMDAPYATHLIDGIVITIEILLGVIAALIIAFTISGLLRNRKNVFPFMALGILVLSGLSVYLQNVYLGTPFATIRMALFYLFPFFLALACSLDMIPFPKKYVTVLPFALGIIFVIHTLRTASFRHSYGWNFGEDNKAVAAFLNEQHSKDPNGRICLSYNDQFSFLGFDYYKLTNKMAWLDLVSDSTFLGDPLNDFAYVSPDRRKFIPDSTWKVLQQFHSGNVIMQPKQPFHALPFTIRLSENTFGKTDPEESILNSKHGSAGCIGEFKDTIPAAERFLFKGTISIKQSEGSHGVLFLTFEHYHHEYCVRTWDLDILKSKTGVMETITVTAPVPANISDRDMISFYAGYAGGEPFEVSSISTDLVPYAK